MYIEPNTSIYILKGVPLDPTYDHTIYWYDINAQVNYFYSKVKYTFARQTYQRVNRGYMRIQRKAEDLYDCNYLMFQNTAFGNKWFFAFITEINYVNNEVSEVRYQIDVMQTYHFDYALGQCFVEREHSETDNVGDNLIPENLFLGELVSEENIVPDFFKDWDIVFWCTRDGFTNVAGRYDILTKTITGLLPKPFPYLRNNVVDINGVSDAITWWRDQLFKPASFITVCPSFWVENMKKIEDDNMSGYSYVNPEIEITRNMTLYRSDGQQVKNNKCLTHPFNFLYVTNNQGVSQTYKYEWFGYDSITPNKIYFEFLSSVSPDCNIIAFPYFYLKNPQDGFRFDYSIALPCMIPVSLNEDTFNAWLAQKGSSNVLYSSFIGQQAMELGQARGSVDAKHFAQSAKHFSGDAKHFANQHPEWLNDTSHSFGNSGWMTVAGMLAEGFQSILTPGKNVGTQGSFTGMNQAYRFSFMNRHISPEIATIIDDYFTRYGYACHKLKVPNRNSRPQFNYVQTVDCLIEALDTQGHGLPADDEATICDIYNKGITFWKNPANIGDYTVNNAPTNQ